MRLNFRYLKDPAYIALLQEGIMNTVIITFFCMIFGFTLGLIVALIATAIMRSKLKSVRHKYQAVDYVRPGSMNVTVAREIFLYHHVSRTPRPKDSDSGTHFSSSGRSHGGGGGKF